MSALLMTAKTLNALKGWPQPAAVDFHTVFSAAALALLDPIPQGSVVSLNSTGEYNLGVGNAAVMPMFMFNASNDPDVVNDGGDPATERGVWVSIGPTGQAMALVAIGAYELVSTAFDTTGSYLPNDFLTSPTSGANVGKLVEGVRGTNMIVGQVSRGVVNNGYGTPGLAFWPIPIYPTP